MSFHYLTTASLAAGVLQQLCNPAGLSPRCLVEADAWSWFRIKSLRFRLFALTTQAYAGYVEGQPDTVPASGAQIMELVDSVTHLAGSQTQWSEWVSVPRVALAGALPWYKTIQGTNTTEEEIPGVIAIAGTGTNIVNLETRFVIEFKGPIASANTPAMVALREKQREERAAKRARDARALLIGTIAASTVSDGVSTARLTGALRGTA